MWSERRPTSRSVHSSYSNNFQLLKLKNLQMRLNPEQAQSFSHHSHPSTPRYDKQSKVPSKKFRVHRQKYKYNQKTESGKTVYEIFNIRNKSSIDSSSQNSSGRITSEIFSHRNRQGLLKQEHSVSQPQPLKSIDKIQSKPIQQNRQNKPAWFEERKWDMNEPTKNVECNVGSIRSQEFRRQAPLNPGRLQQQIKLCPIQEEGKPQISLSEQEEDKGLSSNHNTPMKADHRYRLSLQKQLVQKLNSQTRYMRYRHNEKLKKTLKSNQSIFISKQPSNNKIDKFVLKFGDPVQTILRVMHHNSSKVSEWEANPLHRNKNKNKIKISIEIPEFFYNSPDPYLSEEQLKFKGISYLEESGIIPSHNSQQTQITIIKHPESFMFQYTDPQQFYAKQINDNQQNPITSSCINWYRDDSVYMGQIQNDFREGIGMEWVPGVYVYYGQYKNNFRHGYGVMKYNNMKTYVGTWAYDHYHGYGKVVSPEGDVVEAGTFRNSQLKSSNVFHELS